MNRPTTLLLAVVLVIGSVPALPVAATATVPAQSTALQADANATNVTPGERLSGVIGAGQAEFDGELELRAYGIAFAKAKSNASKADVVKARLAAIQERLAELEAKRAALEEARENGSISEGEYRARVTELAARTETVEQLANASEARANSLPAEVLASKDINVSAIRTLKMNAENLTGPEVAAIARSIAGPNVGQAISRGPPADIGSPPDDVPGDGEQPAAGDGADDAQAAIDSAAEQLDAAETRLEQAEQRVGQNASDNATEALEQARMELEEARQDLRDARAAAEAGDHDEAIALAEDALDHAEAAEEHAQEAIDAAARSGSENKP